MMILMTVVTVLSRRSCQQLITEVLLLLNCWLIATAAANNNQPSPACIEQGLCTCYSTLDPPACYDLSIYHCTGTNLLALGAEPTGQCAIRSSDGADITPSTVSALPPDTLTTTEGSQARQVLFDDNFETIDSSKWGYDIGDGSDYRIPGWGNAEFECYTTDPGNAAIIPNPDDPSDGVLRIRSIHFDVPQTCINRYTDPSQQQWTSAKLTTRNLHSFEAVNGLAGCQSVVIVARIQLPLKQGHWAAFWILPQDPGQGWPQSGEIDIMEHVNMDPEVLGTVHLADAAGSHMQAPSRNRIPIPATELQGFNIYKLVWGCDNIKWYVNNNFAYSVHKADLPNWPFDKPFYIMLNLAVGGYLPGFDADLSGGEMLVDYVRVYRTAA